MDKQSISSVPRIWKGPEQPTFRRTFELDADDHSAIEFSTKQMLPFWPFVLGMSGLAFFVILIFNYETFKSGRLIEFAVYVGGSVGLCMLFAAAAVYPLRKLWRWLYRRKLLKHGAIGVLIESVVDQYGIYTSIGGQETKCSWDSLYAIEEDEESFYFWLSHLSAHPWPARLFSSQEERDTFRRQVEEWSGQAVQPPALARMGEIGRQNLPQWK